MWLHTRLWRDRIESLMSRVDETLGAGHNGAR
jgi:hypothetical protein